MSGGWRLRAGGWQGDVPAQARNPVAGVPAPHDGVDHELVDGRRQTADGRRQMATGTKWRVSGNGAGRFAGASAARGVDHGLHQGVVQQAVELALLFRRLAGGFFAACLGHQGGQAEVGCLGVLIDEIGQ